jgi:hypothetical protein
VLIYRFFCGCDFSLPIWVFVCFGCVWVVVDFDFLKEEMNIDLGFFNGCFMAFILFVYGVFGGGSNRVVDFCVGDCRMWVF